MRGAVCTYNAKGGYRLRLAELRTTRDNTQFHLGSAISGSGREEEAPRLNQLSPFVKEVANSIAGKRHHDRGRIESLEKVTRAVQGGCRGDGGGVSGDACDIHVCMGMEPAMWAPRLDHVGSVGECTAVRVVESPVT